MEKNKKILEKLIDELCLPIKIRIVIGGFSEENRNIFSIFIDNQHEPRIEGCFDTVYAYIWGMGDLSDNLGLNI